ncbi:MAG: chitobiase/beta-hexosaminidase C-terminal domain-containing protein [Fibrobacteria bacterium]
MTLLTFLAFATVTTAGAQADVLVAAPVMQPQGDSGWIGSTEFKFKNVANGRIYYTLDGTTPTTESYFYIEGQSIAVDHSLTVSAVHYNLLNVPSDVVRGNFIRAKLPAPYARYGGNTTFYPSLLCSLFVDRPSGKPVIHYTLDGSQPTAASPVYGTPIKVTKTQTIKAYATESGLDDSDPMQVAFVIPPAPAAPQATPSGMSFSTNTLLIKLKSASTGIYFRYTLDTALKDWSKAPIVSGDSISILGQTIGENIILRAQAWKNGYPPSATMTEKYTYSPPVAMPGVSRTPGPFYDTATVLLTCATPGANLRYTLDGSTPTAASLDGNKPVLLDGSVRLRALALKAPQPNSAMLDVNYILKLSAPVLDKPSRQFQDSLHVKITSMAPKASIYYTLDNDSPTVAKGVLIRSGDSITLSADSTTVLKAVVIKDGIISALTTASYTKIARIVRLSAPVIDPPGKEFEDSQYVELRTSDSLAEIRYTTDGTLPTRASRKYAPGAGLWIDSTTVLRAQAYPTKGNMDSSAVNVESYILVPSPPTATPDALSPFPNSISVTLSCKSKKAEIRYWLGSTLPVPELSSLYAGTPIILNSTTRLQAKAVSNSGGVQRYSQSLDVTYSIYTTAPSDTLMAGSTRTLTGGFVFTNHSSLPILAKTHTTSEFSLTGFKDASLAVLILPTATGQTIKLGYSKPQDVPVSLYRFANGQAEFLSNDSHVDLDAGGEYFVGIDTLPPVITLLSQVPKAGDSTALRLKITDNTSNPACKIQSPGTKGGMTTRKPGADGEITVLLQMPLGDFKGLWFRAVASDFYGSSLFPKEANAKMYLSQSWNRLNTPAVLTMGRQDVPWDLAGFPNSGKEPLLWGNLRRDNPGADLQARRWSDNAGESLPLDDSSVIAPGTAVWMGSPTLRNSVAITGFRASESEADGTCRMGIHHGWNQITSPLLDKVYWPISTSYSRSGGGLLKAPWRWIPKLMDYAQVDSLEPWVGYFVYYHGERDTTVTVATDLSRRLAKPGASTELDRSQSVAIALDFGRQVPLYLGATTWAQDAAAAEDEPALPAFQRNFSAWSQRGKRRLLTDLVKFNGGSPMHWNVVLEDAGGVAGESLVTGSIHVREGSLPAGYQAWAVSTTRGLKFQLQSGLEMPWSGMSQDTLSIYVGTTAGLAGIPELSRAVSEVVGFAFDLEKGVSGNSLRMALPWNCQVEADIWSLDGRLLTRIRPGRLNPGIYRLALTHGSNSAIAFLKIRLQNENGTKEFSRKVLW